MENEGRLVDDFEEHRPRLRAVAYRMLGSLAEADDAVQDAWVRASRAGTGDVENVGAWLTTIVARVCLNMLRARSVRRHDPLDASLPDPILSPEGALGPEDEAVLADSVGLALQVVIDTLAPAERVAFVLHDMFDLPFDEIATMVGRSPQAARQLASRARRRVRGTEPPEPDLARQRAVVDAFYAAGRAGDFDALLAVLHPDVVLRGELGTRHTLVRGADAVASQARLGARLGAEVHPVLVNGAAGAVTTVDGRPFSVMAFTVVDGRIVEIDVIAGPERVAPLAAPVLGYDQR